MKYTFPETFKIGATGAAWQMEGEKDKLPHQKHYPHLMWENDKERWFGTVGPDVACDLYDHYHEDYAMFAEAGVKQYRFNIDWSRFIDDYEAMTVNEQAAKYYSDSIDRLIECGIEPVLCLEHWELPAYLYEKYDGYASPVVVDKFVRYAGEAFKRYGDRVKMWFTFNEPVVIPQLCFQDGFWWPNEKNPARAYRWMHGKVMATARVIKLFREMKMEGEIGVILNSSHVIPRDENNPGDVQAAEVARAFYWGNFLDPAVKGEYPALYLEILEKEGLMFDFTEEEKALLRENTVDILGVNYYQPMRVMEKTTSWDENQPFHPSKYFDNYDMPGKRMNPFRGWEIYPKCLYDIGMRIKNEYGNVKWLISESGMGVQDEGKYRDENGIIQDDYRIDFISEHLAWLSKAVGEGSNCHGYWLFASIDNCSPYNAFKNRYGLVEVDIADGFKRRFKKSAAFYKAASDTNSFEYKELESC